MRKRIQRSVLAVAVLSLLAVPAMAELFTVTLSSGATFETRYKPEIASWDANKVLLLTTVGNLIGLDKADITNVSVDHEVAGYGRVIDNTTVDMGFTANDNPSTADQPPASPQERLLAYLESQQGQQQPVYNTEQFVEPSAATGIPLSMTTTTTPPMGGGGTGPEPINN